MKVIEVAPINMEQVEREARDVMVLVEESQGIVIRTQTENEVASKILQTVKAKYKELDAKRKTITQPLDEAKKQVMELFRDPLTKLEEAEGIIKKAMIAFANEQERRAKEEQRQLQELADKEVDRQRKLLEAKIQRAEVSGKEEKAEKLKAQQEAIILIVPVVAQPQIKTDGISYRDQWKAVVTDINQVPREYMVVNQQALDKIAQTMKGVITIPGVRFECNKIVASR